MGRHKKKCHIGKYPATGCFISNSNALDEVNIRLDELEAMRLVDVEAMSQIEASEFLGVSRGSVQRLLNSGRKKIVSALVAGKNIILETNDEKEILNVEAGKNLHIAMIMEGDSIGGHFGHAKSIKLFEVDHNTSIVSEMTFSPRVSGGKARAHWLYESNVSILITSSCGEGAFEHLKKCGIQVLDGSKHTIETVFKALKTDELNELKPHVQQK